MATAADRLAASLARQRRLQPKKLLGLGSLPLLPPLLRLPGQIGNPVGFINTPTKPPSPWLAGQTPGGTIAGQWVAPAWPGRYPGSLTAAPAGNYNPVGGTAANPQVIAFQSFTSQVTLANPYVLFVGCQFLGQAGSSAISLYGEVGGYHVGLFYCTFMPTAVSAIPNSAWPNATPGNGWPSSGANTGVAYTSNGPAAYTITNAQGYAYAIATTHATTWQDWIMDHCDCWGSADGFDLAAAIAQPGVLGPVLTQDCWMHDGRADGGAGGDHTDGIGGLVNSLPNNWTVNRCTISGFGNTSAIAMQGPGVIGLTITNCYLSGWNHLLQFPPSLTGTCTCTDNVIGTDVVFGGVGFDSSAAWQTSLGNTWRRNKLHVVPGYVSSWGTTASAPIWTPAMDGYFVWADTSYNPTEYPL